MTKSPLSALIIAAALFFSLPLTAAASANGANDYLMTLSPNDQAKMLGKVVGDGCRGKKAFYQGSVGDHALRANEIPPLAGHEHDAIWSLKCADGRAFSVGVIPNGQSQVLECAVLEALHGGHCFKKFD
jgi:hypothetical protein